MKLIIFTLIAVCYASICFSSDVELIGETKVDSIKYSDGTIQTTANTPGVKGDTGLTGHSPILTWSGDQIAVDGFIYGPHLTGPPGERGLDGLPAPVAPERILYINRLSISDFVPIWLTQGNNWQAFNPAISLSFTKLSDNSILRVQWSDNVGIYSSSWCNIGLFIDDQTTTQCTGSWSGISGTTVFNQQTVSCVLSGISAGAHSIQVKNRSQYCVYGNYAFDNSGSNRFISVEEQN